MSIIRTDLELCEYENQLRIVAVTNNLIIGWDIIEKDNLLNRKIFVKDSEENYWEEEFQMKEHSIQALYELWEKIECLMMEILEKKPRNAR